MKTIVKMLVIFVFVWVGDLIGRVITSWDEHPLIINIETSVLILIVLGVLMAAACRIFDDDQKR